MPSASGYFDAGYFDPEYFDPEYFGGGAGAPGSLQAPVAAFVSSGPAGVAASASPATGGAAPYAYRWRRSADGVSYADLADGAGVAGAATLDLLDGSAVAGVRYYYRLACTDAAADVVASDAVRAAVYNGEAVGGVAYVLVPVVG